MTMDNERWKHIVKYWSTAVCINQRLYAKEPKITHFAIVYFLELCPSYNLITTHYYKQ